MAAYISVPRDLTKVKSKVMFNLTARQLICFGAAAVVGVPLFFVLRDTAGNLPEQENYCIHHLHFDRFRCMIGVFELFCHLQRRTA